MPSHRQALIVDDEPNIVLSLEFLLKKNKFEVLIARDGSEALHLLEANTPDIVVLDIMMPRLDGYAVASFIRQQARLAHVKIVFLTAKSKESDVLKGYDMGADLYLTKPFSTRDLMARLRELLPEPSPKA